jgi:hypothetical protein
MPLCCQPLPTAVCSSTMLRLWLRCHLCGVSNVWCSEGGLDIDLLIQVDMAPRRFATSCDGAMYFV